MNQELAQIDLYLNEDSHRLEMNIEGHIAYVEYEIKPDYWELTHTLVPEELAGRGVGKVLAEKVFSYLEANNRKVKVYCPFLIKYLSKNPEWKKVTI